MKTRIPRIVAAIFLVTVVVIQAIYIWFYFASGAPKASLAEFGLDHIAFALEQLVIVGFAVLGALLISRRPKNVMGWLFALGSLALSLGGNTPVFSWFGDSGLLIEYDNFVSSGGRIFLGGSQTSVQSDAYIYGLAANSAGWALLVVGLFLFFPTGRLPSKRWIPVAVLGGLFGVQSVIVWFPVAGMLPDWTFEAYSYRVYVFDSFLGLTDVLWVLTVVVCGAALVARYRKSSADERQQIKWFALAGVLVAATALLWMTLFYTGAPLSNDTWSAGLQVAFSVTLLFLPVATGIAVFKYRLYEIDLFIRRTILFGSLAAFITVGYIAVTVGVGRLLGGSGERPLALSLVATGVIAVAFQPVRERAEKLAGRLVYGEQAEPYEVLAGLARRVGETVFAEELLPFMAETAAHAVRAKSAVVKVFLADGEELTASWPADGDASSDDRLIVTKQPVVYLDESVGEIEVRKPRNDPLRPSEERLLSDLAAQAGLAMHKLRLTVELQHRLDQIRRQAEELENSQNRIMTADLWAQLKLKRELGGRVESALTASGEILGEAERTLFKDQTKVEGLLQGAVREARRALDELRELSRGVFPPLLSEEGIVVALRSQIRRTDWRVRFSVSPGAEAQRFDSHTESAVYFCCVEALKHLSEGAEERLLELELTTEKKATHFAVAAPSASFEMPMPAGILQEMADRVEALGGTLDVRQGTAGGTRISGQIPSSEHR